MRRLATSPSTRHDLVLRDQLGDGVRRLFGLALVVLDEQLDLAPAEQPAGVVDLLDGELGAFVDDWPNDAPSPVSDPYMPDENVSGRALFSRARSALAGRRGGEDERAGEAASR